MPYVIHKWSRSAASVSYNGPACKKAGVTGGKIYENIKEAESDAEKLSRINPVGFLVSELPANKE
jgi:hypothetical protein